MERIVPRGFGIAFTEGLTILVALAAPGDEVTVRLTHIKKRLAFAEIVSVNAASSMRQGPPCPYFGMCGGCDFQHLSYDAQLQAKVGIIHDSLKRIGKIDLDRDVPIIRSQPLGYRSRVRWQVDPAQQKFGYFMRGSHEIVDVEHCPKITPELNATLEELRRTLVQPGLESSQMEISAVSGGDGDVSIHSTMADERAKEVTWSSGTEEYTYSAETFFQANKSLISDLVEAAVGNARGTIAFDLYSGVGLFTLPLARRFDKVLAVEEHSESSAMCKRNLNDAGLDNGVGITRSVRRFLADNRTRGVDLVLLDPPRAGTEKGVIKMLADLRPREISYVSCDPSILGRDLRELLDSGYELVGLTALDLFPQTHHVETVARLKRQ